MKEQVKASLTKNSWLRKSSDDRFRSTQSSNFRLSSTKKSGTETFYTTQTSYRTTFLNNKNIKYLNNTAPIEIIPPEIFFKNIKENQLYEILVSVRNLTKVPRRVRIAQPQTSKFRCDYDMQSSIAAGLAMQLVITFETNEKGEFHDVIKITSEENFTYELLLHATPPKAELEFDSIFNMDFIHIGKEKIGVFYIKNVGQAVGKVEIKKDKLVDFNLDPPYAFSLKPGEIQEIKASLKPRESGIIKGFFEVFLDNQQFPKYIDVNATVVEFNRFLVDELGNHVNIIDFGTLYFGELREIKTKLVNNTPKKVSFSLKFRSGLSSVENPDLKLVTPHQLGIEATEKIISSSLMEGEIDCYSEKPIVLKCQSTITEKHENLTKEYAISTANDKEKVAIIEEHAFSAIFEFSGESDPTIVHLSAKSTCPLVKISQRDLNFGECPMNERRDLLVDIENTSDELPIDISFQKISYFFCNPETMSLKPLQKSCFYVTFQPRNIGKILTSMDLKLMKGKYRVPLKLMGTTLSISEVSEKKRGPEFWKDSNNDERVFVEDNKEKPNYIEKHLFSSSSSVNIGNTLDKSKGLTEKFEEYYKTLSNKKKYNMVIQDSRKERERQKIDKFLDVKIEEATKKLRQKGIIKDLTEEEEEKTKGDPPVDFEFYIGEKRLVESPRLEIPKGKETLFVTKPIDRYEPFKETKSSSFKPDPTLRIRKKYPDKAKSHAEARDCQAELKGEELQKIFAGPTQIDFGKVYVNSVVTRTFTVRNDLRSSIYVRLEIEHKELKDSYKIPQVIPTSQTAGFEITFQSKDLGPFKGFVKYIINDKHKFEFLVLAQVEPVTLDVNPKQLKFTFDDDDEDMIARKRIVIENKGNAAGKFKWTMGDQKIFSVHPNEGSVPSGSSLEVEVTYKPSGSNSGKNEEEKLIMKVEDGDEQVLKCVGFTNETKCSFKDEEIDLGEIPICKKEEKRLGIINHHKFNAVYQFSDKLPSCIEMDSKEMRGKIVPAETVFPKITFFSKEEQVINSEIVVYLRGGKPLRLPFKASTIIPKVSIVEEEFDFGGVTTLGNSGILKMTLQNLSTIEANLILNLKERDDGPKEYEGIECLEVFPEKDQGGGDESLVMMSINEGDLNEDGNFAKNSLVSHFLDEGNRSDDSAGEEEDDNKPSTRLYRITVKPNIPVVFNLKFSPKDVRNYSLELPLILEGFGRLESLTRPILCKGIKPRFLMERQIITFKKKIITSAVDKVIPSFEEVTISNPDNKPLRWRIDVTDLDGEKGVFSIVPSEGKLEGGQTTIIKTSFNPKLPGDYEKIIPLFIDNETALPYLKIMLKGSGAFPKLTFDRREVILPVVPLGITAKCHFRIINDGYENLTLKHLIGQELDGFHLEVNYIDGKTLGITKNKIRVEISFHHNKPFSFTTLVEFQDDNNRGYSIPVSGTTDNSLFTIYPFFQRCENDIKIINFDKDNKPLQLIEQSENGNSRIEEDIIEKGNNHKIAHSKAGSVISNRSTRSVLGYSPIPQDLLDKSMDYLRRWLNFYALSEPIQVFPADIVSKNGVPIFELVTYLTNKQLGFKAKIDPNAKRVDRIKALLKQYEDLLRYLKEIGGLLNTIRPQYLLSYSDYTSFLKLYPFELLSQSSHKISEGRFNYIAQDSWIFLIYQIMKLFLLNRINSKTVKFPNTFPADKITFPDYALDGCNYLSTPELVLLRWLEICYDMVKAPKNPRRLKNFDSDLRDCNHFATVIQSYVVSISTSYLNSLKSKCTTPDDYELNVNKIMDVLNERIRMNSHIKKDDINNPSGREIILFVIHLFNNLHHYIPKNQSIVFSCVLGEEVTKNIELFNPSNKPISYWINKEGSSDFIVEGDSIKVEPGPKPTKLKVRFISRISQSVTGRLTFTNKKEANAQAAAIVFDLKSQITHRKSIEVWEAESKLYENFDVKLTIKNNFTTSTYEYAEFSITLIHESDSNQGEETKKRGRPKKENKETPLKEGSSPVQNQTVVEDYNTLIPPFFSKIDKIRIRRGESAQLAIQYMPFSLDIHKCKIIFCDLNVGEFQHEIIGYATLPDPIGGDIKLPFTLYVDSNIKYEFPINFKNEKLMNAKKTHENRLITSGKNKERELYAKLKNQLNQPEINFEVEMKPSTHPSVTIPYSFTLFDPNKKSKITTVNTEKEKEKEKPTAVLNTPGTLVPQASKDKMRKSIVNPGGESSIDGSRMEYSSDNSINKLPMDFHFKQSYKDLTLKIILKNKNKSDIRVFRFVISVNPKIIKAKMEFRVPYGEEVKQEIPVINNSEKDWQIKCNLTADPNGENGQYFSGGKDLVVRRKGQNNYIVFFKPPFILTAKAKLTMTNMSTNDVFEYELFGYGEEPLAKDHIILNCIARKSTKKEIIIENNGKDTVNYKVETDLVNAEGPTSFSIPAGKSYKYNLIVTPLLGGQYTGSITFFEENEERKRFIWYTVLVVTDRPRSEKTIDLTTFVRKTVAFDISLNNPLKEVATFEVLIEGEGLLGENFFSLSPGQTSTYELLFSPLRNFKGRGSIAFIHEKLGEIWYDLTLNSEENPVIRLPTLKAELGKIERYRVSLENPSSKEVDVTYKIKNSNNFDVGQDTIKIAPYDSTDVDIRYTPSDLDVQEFGEILFESQDIGRWQFLAFGTGLPPTPFEPKILAGSLNKDISSTINFKNPFKMPISVTIEMLSDEKGHLVFELLSKKSKTSIPAMSILQIPFSFTPREISEYYCEISIFMNEKIQWKYPIKGITESYSNQISYNFKSKSRETLETEMRIVLPGLPQSMIDGKEFVLEIINIPSELENLIKKYFQITKNKSTLFDPQDFLIYGVSFKPMKPFKATVEILVSRPAGGRWRFKVNLESSEPECDDIIHISSPLNKTTSVSFKLTNKHRAYAPFQAYFTAGSDSEFAIMPKSGDLEPSGREGKNFIISFTPVEYGKTKEGKLIIETDELYWSYLVKGTLPLYKPPQGLAVTDHGQKHDHENEAKSKALTTQTTMVQDTLKGIRGPLFKPNELQKALTRNFSNIENK